MICTGNPFTDPILHTTALEEHTEAMISLNMRDVNLQQSASYTYTKRLKYFYSADMNTKMPTDTVPSIGATFWNHGK
jgi:hypothetical protein